MSSCLWKPVELTEETEMQRHKETSRGQSGRPIEEERSLSEKEEIGSLRTLKQVREVGERDGGDDQQKWGA